MKQSTSDWPSIVPVITIGLAAIAIVAIPVITSIIGPPNKPAPEPTQVEARPSERDDYFNEPQLSVSPSGRLGISDGPGSIGITLDGSVGIDTGMGIATIDGGF